MNIELNLKIIIMILFVNFIYLVFITGFLTLISQLIYDRVLGKGDKKEKKDKVKEEREEKEESDKNKGGEGKEEPRFSLEDQWIRKMSKTVSPFLNKYLGNYYWFLHAFIMITGGTILLFDNNIYHLLILLNISCVDAIACIFLHECPLTILEFKYLKKSLINGKYNCLKNSPILYKCNHNYEKTLEFITNMVCFLFGKINVLIIMKLFNLNFAPIE